VKRTKVLLFDIDGTLIRTGRCAHEALEESFLRNFGVSPDLNRVRIAGITDRNIARQMLTLYDIPITGENTHRFLDTYLALLETNLRERPAGGTLPGVAALVEALRQREDVLLGLLTGNLEQGARIKLSHYGIWEPFVFGAYADDSEHRNDLGPVAHARATEILGCDIAPEDIYVIGDTPRDIECGKVFGARTVAVATGDYTTDALRTDTPDFLFEDFSDVKRVLEIF